VADASPRAGVRLSELAQRLDVPLHREAQRLIEAGLLQARSIGRNRLLRANLSNRATAPLTQLLELTFGPQTVIAEEFALSHVDLVIIFGSWADRYHGTTGPPPHDVDVLVVGDPDRADVCDAAARYAGTALLADQGLRPTTTGGHYSVERA
jgi:hypothetical protein